MFASSALPPALESRGAIRRPERPIQQPRGRSPGRPSMDARSETQSWPSTTSAVRRTEPITVFEGDIEDVLITDEQIQRKIAQIGQEITEDYAGRDLLLIGVLKGAFVLMADL